jgi:hypothetical protein
LTKAAFTATATGYSVSSMLDRYVDGSADLQDGPQCAPSRDRLTRVRMEVGRRLRQGQGHEKQSRASTLGLDKTAFSHGSIPRRSRPGYYISASKLPVSPLASRSRTSEQLVHYQALTSWRVSMIWRTQCRNPYHSLKSLSFHLLG